MKNSNSQTIADVLSKVAQSIRKLNESEIETLLAGDFRIELILGTTKSRQPKNSSSLNDGITEDISDVAQLLQKTDDREQGWSILEQRLPNKDNLISLARYLDLPIQKKESVERLKEKIIEATIGFRLRSAAIRGTETVEKSPS